MKRLVLLVVIFLLRIPSIEAQIETCDCRKDLDFIVAKLKRMPSYRKQIKGQKKEQFENLYIELSSELNNPIGIDACYKILLQQMTMINDVHAALEVNTDFLNKADSMNMADLKTYKKSGLFEKHPRTNKDIAILKEELSNKPQSSIEGIYKYGKSDKIGFYYMENKKNLIGVVLETNLKHWAIGEIRCYLKQTSFGKYDMYLYNKTTRAPDYLKSLTFENGRIGSYKKEGNIFNNELSVDNAEVADFKQINEDTQYLYFATFSNSKRKELKAFITNTIEKLTADNIIVDLRDNGGGNNKYSDPFVKALKHKNVYVITNSFTASNGEQFTLKLLKNKNAKHLGQITRGAIAYGMNYGNSYNTPSGNFRITPTDMNFHKYIEYEGKGILPEIKLDFTKDWIQQTLEIIELTQVK